MRGLLLVMMEPPPAMAEEFHDWYDMEHVPERLAVPGILSATRWVCLEGWPRFLATYDLDGAEVMESAEYLAVAGANLSPWSRRVLPRTVGRRRVVATEVEGGGGPGSDGSGPEPPVLVVAQYPGALPAAALEGLRGRAGLKRLRLFHSDEAEGASWVLAGFDRPPGLDGFAALDGCGAALVNRYVRYLRATP